MALSFGLYYARGYMAGHSKWANIKHRKGRADARKGKLFSRLAKEIISAVKLGGSDPKAMPRLRLVFTKSTCRDLPNDIYREEY